MNGLALAVVAALLAILWMLHRPERTAPPRPTDIAVGEVLGIIATGVLAAAVVLASIVLFLLATPPPA